MRIQTNTAANAALGYMRTNNQATERSIQKLSSGFRINRAGDDAAGLAIANKLRADGKALSQAQKNTAQGISMLQTMDGATQTVATILDRMKELATQANSDNVGNQRDKLNQEFGSLRSEIQRIVDTTQYQGKNLIDGGFGNSVTKTTAASSAFGVTGVSDVTISGAKDGAYTLTATAGGDVTLTLGSVSQTVNKGAGAGELTFDKLGVSIKTTDAYAGGAALNTTGITVAAGSGGGSFQVSSSGSYSSHDKIAIDAINLSTGSAGLNLDALAINDAGDKVAALNGLDTALNKVNEALGKIGASQSRMDFAAVNVATQLQNTQAAESTIRDADMAAEMTAFTKNNILQQAAQSMLSQANQGTQGILQLLRG